MSQIPRNVDYLHRRRICYRRDPVEQPDYENHQYMFFEKGTHQAYDLFKGNAKINTYKSLKWHLLVLWYLNPQLDPDEFNSLSEFIADKENGFTTFSISKNVLERITHELAVDLRGSEGCDTCRHQDHQTDGTSHDNANVLTR